MKRLRDWISARTPKQILLASLVLFWIYCWPGFVGWDTHEHIMQARSGIYTDGHPPAIARLQRICELFITGPLLLMLFQSITLMLGLYMLFKRRVSPRSAAVIASAIFLFPIVSGVTGLVAKDCLMAGPAVMGFALLLDERQNKQWLAVGFLFFATLMRWNALAATFGPMLLLFQARPRIRGVKRYAAALAVWVGLTGAAFAVNEAMTVKREYYWYWSHAYEDIAGTLQWIDQVDDPALHQWLEGVPLIRRDNLHASFRAIYDPAQYFQLVREDQPNRIFAMPTTDEQRAAIKRAWERIVLGHPAAYLYYRYEAFRRLLGLDARETFSRVYVWLSVIAAPETIAQIEHDAAQSKIQEKLIAASIWISLTPIYIPIWYFALCFLLLPFGRRRLDIGILLSGIGYELQWYFLAPSPDLRYSQWMVLCSLIGLALVVTARFCRSQPDAGLPASEDAK
ncbi:MAG: hypothetical protein ACKV2T_20250 [Kofleriaceae bacterium]